MNCSMDMEGRQLTWDAVFDSFPSGLDTRSIFHLKEFCHGGRFSKKN